MSKQTLARTIRKEIKDINWRIDMKIIKGLSYREESRRHKILRMQLNRIQTTTGESWIGRLGALANAFVF